MAQLYKGIISFADKFVPKALRPLWVHPAGPKTVFFWGPVVKWGLVGAGFKDVVDRPVELISLKQTGSLAVTGVIWARYSLVIIPKNWNMLGVNVFIALIQGIQFLRAYNYQMNLAKEQAVYSINA